MGPLGIPETIAIFVLALLIFGPKKLPELGRNIGKAMTEFRRASSELKATFDREMNAIERDVDLKSTVSPQNYNGETYNYDSYYDSGSYGYESSESTAQTYSTTGESAPQDAATTSDQTQGDQTLGASNTDAATEADNTSPESQATKS